jgi:cobalt-zinc-cadmium efflux system membrane fusion protein
MFMFPLEREAMGTISFADDPDWVPAESTLLSASAAYELARRELVRVKSLGTPNGIAQKDLETAISNEEAAEAAYKAARDALRALGKTDAEIDRMVARGRIEAAEEHRSVKWVTASALESDSPLVRTGEPVKVAVPAFPDKVFEGSVATLYGTVDPNSHRVALRAEVDDPRDELRPGMLADVTIEVLKPEASIGIPENGVVREGDGTMTAWVTADRHHFAQRVVKTGLREDGRVQITAGVKSGELVVTDGAVFLDNILNAAPSD